jgi:toxin ParE1/3/4
MARFRLSRPAQMDIANIFATGTRQWGVEAERRYAVVLASAMRQVAADPEGRVTRGHGDLLPGIRSFHLRHARVDDPGSRVRRPVHVLYYRAIEPEVIEIFRVLHERMDPARQIRETPEDGLDEPPEDRDPPAYSLS